jgi:aspartate carbamoyltransferase
MRHILSVSDLENKEIRDICKITDSLIQMRPLPCLKGKIVANLFYESSTRTSSSFFSAATRLGATVLPVNEVEYSSISKGETLEDTIRTMGEYVDMIVLRHPENDAAERSAAVSSVPIINAGCGSSEHPTQALLDYYTIQNHFVDTSYGRVFFGDLKGSRTAHSLDKLLKQLDSPGFIYYISPPGYEMPKEMNWQDISGYIDCADVLYVVRPQIERHFIIPREYCLTPELADQMPENGIIMHPFPRTAELPVEIDKNPRSVYFEQIRNGLYVRMALMTFLAGENQ